MKKLFKTILALTLSLSILAGCTSSPSSAEADTPSAKTDLTIAITKDINGLDPASPGNTLTQSVIGNVYEYLLKRDENDKVVASLAENWENIDDTTWEFTLRSGVTFHSGNPLTAKDVQFSLMRIQEERFSERANYKNISEIKIIDDLTFQIITDGPDPVLLNRISRLGSGILDSKLFEEVGEEAFLNAPSGTGPYKFVSWNKDESVDLQRNDDYHGSTPVWENVKFRVIPESSTRVAELLTGGVDIALDISPNDESRINENEGTHVERFSTKRVLYWVVNTTTPGLDDPKVREAIDLAIDDQAIVDQIYGGAATPIRTMVPPVVFGSNPELCNTYLYDLEKAKSLLAESGHAGLEFELASGNGQYLRDKELTELVGAMLEQAGFKVNYSILETSRFTEIKNARGFTGLRMNGYSSSMSDASKDLVPFTQENPIQFTGWHNAEFDDLAANALVSMDSESRLESYQRMQEIQAEERPIIPMVQMMGFYGVSDQISYSPRMDEIIWIDDITLK